MISTAAPRTPSSHRLLSGMFAGFVGTAALSAFERLEQALLGRAPGYAAPAVGLALMRRTGLVRSNRRARHVGLLLRWLYGPSLGAAYALLQQPREAHSELRSGLWLSAAIYLFEIVAMPAAKATKPVREWDPAEVILLSCHTSVFALTTAAVLGRGARARVKDIAGQRWTITANR